MCTRTYFSWCQIFITNLFQRRAVSVQYKKNRFLHIPRCEWNHIHQLNIPFIRNKACQNQSKLISISCTYDPFQKITIDLYTYIKKITLTIIIGTNHGNPGPCEARWLILDRHSNEAVCRWVGLISNSSWVSPVYRVILPRNATNVISFYVPP